MQIKAEISYNLDMLCFINVMTADKLFVERHCEAFDKFYPLISGETKQNIESMVLKHGSMLSPFLTLLISSLSDFNSRSLTEMLRKSLEIETSMSKTPYKLSREKLDSYFAFCESAIIPLLEELERAGFHEFWQKNRLPLIKEKCSNINDYLSQYDVTQLMGRYRSIDNSANLTVYLCSFTDPLGIKLCGDNLISDSSYGNDTILSNATHEAFHPPYDTETVKPYLDKIAQKPWVQKAFENQTPPGYGSMYGFIEENIVEALGIYVVTKLGVNIDPIEYFKTHDDGSHVISPFFYKYLCEAVKDVNESFENYFINFVDTFDD